MQEFSIEDLKREISLDNILDIFLYEEEYNRINKKIFSDLNIDCVKKCDVKDTYLEEIAREIENYIKESVYSYDSFEILKKLVFI